MCNRTNTTVGLERISTDFISDLWLALKAVTLHFVWTDRNRRFFDQRSATPTVPALFLIYTTFSVHVRYYRRHVTIKTNAFGSQKCWINSQRKDHLVDSSAAEDHCCGYGTDKSKSKCNSDPSPSWLALFNLVWRTAHQFAKHAFPSWTQSRIKMAEATAAEYFQRKTYYRLSQFAKNETS
ncbi:unnamed protein product [Albugo candida]|uniref:Uncharacterized protein n=1 Tax=Albugo candida TaxID=65357 RepID=A0A024G0D1_9STRA|nr:unnamed protein product [Albugo candida]|eukprot:CCI40224.1 unnamed protein product [Albugo candida]